MRKKLDEAHRAALKIADDSSPPAASWLSARRTLRMIDEVNSHQFRNVERTLVVTRINRIDPSLPADSTISEGLLQHFTDVIEVSRSGRVIWVHR